MEQVFCCTTCPSECDLTVVTDADGGFVSVTGNRCARGDAFARQEIIRPVRVLTSTVSLKGARHEVLLPVRSDKAFPLDMHREAMKELNNAVVEVPVKMGDVIIAHLLGQDVAIVAACDAR